MSAQPPIPVDPAQAPVQERAADYQLEFIAQMSVLGVPVDTMAVSTGLTVRYIKRLFADKQNETFNRKRDEHLAARTKQIVAGHFKLADMLDDAYEGVRTCITSNDMRVKAENSWKLIDRVVPNLNEPKSNGNSGGISLILNQPEIQTQVGETMNIVAEVLLSLRGAIEKQDPEEHVLHGIEALPTPPSQLEVQKGEAPLEPSENPKTDLRIEMLDDTED